MARVFLMGAADSARTVSMGNAVVGAILFMTKSFLLRCTVLIALYSCETEFLSKPVHKVKTRSTEYRG